MKTFKLAYFLSNQGDGSAALNLYSTLAEAKKEEAKEDEPFAEDSANVIRLKVEGEHLYYEGYDLDTYKPIWIRLP
jgi:hypothetical protein